MPERGGRRLRSPRARACWRSATSSRRPVSSRARAPSSPPPTGKGIQAGVYLLPKGMSGKNAVTHARPGQPNNLIYPGQAQLLGLRADRHAARHQGRDHQGRRQGEGEDLGLPDWANDNKNIKDPLEGFLYPATYPVAKGMKPEAVLKKMVARRTRSTKRRSRGRGPELGLKTPLQVITVASLVQAEGKYDDDFDKVARVVYNRLKPNNTETIGRLEFDSTINYIKSESKLDIGAADDLRQNKDPYNTYDIKGLPPGPIGNPGRRFGSARIRRRSLDTTSSPSPRTRRSSRSPMRSTRSSRGNSKSSRRRTASEHAEAAGGGPRIADRPLPLPGAAPGGLRGTRPRPTGRTTASRWTRRGCPGFVEGLDDSWAGLSLTMPLKRAIMPLLDGISDTAASVEAVNTVVFTEDGRRLGDNTDIPGMIAALRERGVDKVGIGRRAGRGRDRVVRARRAPRICTGPVIAYVRSRPGPRRCAAGASGSVSRSRIADWAEAATALRAPLVIATTPAGATDELAHAVPARPGTLFDVLYDPWPTALAAAWSRARRGRGRRPRPPGPPGGAPGRADDGPRPRAARRHAGRPGRRR